MSFSFFGFSLSPLHIFLLVVLVLFVVAVIQATNAVVKYRRNFGDAPLPIIPSHGVVVAKDKETPPLENMPKESLRLLLVGDSLACGVGQSVKCTPVMPEVISRALSLATGKAVYWTCHGESGASAGWIIRELERGMDHESDQEGEYGACGCDGMEVGGTLSGNDIQLWKEKLERYRRRFNPDELGPYDIVVLLTGTNDLKIMYCPCLVMEEDREFRQRGGSFIDDLQALIQNISIRMKRGVRNFSERASRLSRKIRGNTEEFESLLDGLDASERATSLVTAVSEDLSFDDAASETNGISPTRGWPNGSSHHRTPLFVLPAMPIRTSPSVRPVPLRWLTLPFFDRMEAKKRKLARSSPGELLWVNDPSLEDVIEYEEQRGSIWEQQNQEEVLLSLRYVRGGDCSRVSEAMKKYYQSKSDSFDTVNDSTPLCERPGLPGTKVYCADSIHPNEAGYEFWARHIAKAIIADMNQRTKHQTHIQGASTKK